MPFDRRFPVLACIVALATIVNAQQPGPSKPVERGFTSLFNGKDLTGWKIGTPVEDFHVVDGAIEAHGTTSACGGCGHLFYDGPFLDHTFRNFDLRLDVMAKAHANGGVYICTQYQDAGFPTHGFEVQVNNSHTDHIRTGSLYHVVDLSYVPAQDDEWFPMEIVVRGKRVTISLKGSVVVDWTQPPDWKGTWDFADRVIAPGTIALQAHDPGSYSYYKNIRIKPLP